ncbi:MAG: hypothetical protein QM784_38490 [Polyangiaceae bacterium]
MGHEHGGYVSVLVESVEPLAEFDAHSRVEGPEGFVEKQHLGFGG